MKWKSINHEMIAVDIKTVSQSLEIIAYYSPNCSYSILEEIFKVTENRNNCPMIIGGDLNLSELNWQGAVSDKNAQIIINKLVWDAGLT